jgi:O-acetylhomoserine/O-acetylserine sulfhydrylase-like pyridoxal-dependent enzyme
MDLLRAVGIWLTVVTVESLHGAIRRIVLQPHLGDLPGGAETLLTRPALTSHAGMDPDQRRGAGISDGLIRMSVGLESPEEIVDDLLQALETAAVSTT